MWCSKAWLAIITLRVRLIHFFHPIIPVSRDDAMPQLEKAFSRHCSDVYTKECSLIELQLISLTERSSHSHDLSIRWHRNSSTMNSTSFCDYKSFSIPKRGCSENSGSCRNFVVKTILTSHLWSTYFHSRFKSNFLVSKIFETHSKYAIFWHSSHSLQFLSEAPVTRSSDLCHCSCCWQVA